MTNAVCVSNSAGDPCLRWDGTNRSGLQAVGPTKPTMDAGSMAFTYHATAAQLVATYRRVGEATDVTIRLNDVQTLSDTVTGINTTLGGLTGQGQGTIGTGVRASVLMCIMVLSCFRQCITPFESLPVSLGEDVIITKVFNIVFCL